MEANIEILFASIFRMTLSMKAYFAHVSVYFHCIFPKKIFRLKYFFYQTFGFPTFIKTYLRKTDFLFCFGIRNSRMITYNGLPSLESADAV